MELEVIKMTQKTLLNIQGSQIGEMNLDDKVFAVEPNIHVMHLALMYTDYRSKRV